AAAGGTGGDGAVSGLALSPERVLSPASTVALAVPPRAAGLLAVSRGNTCSTSSSSACGLAYARLPTASTTNTRPRLNQLRRRLGRVSDKRARRTPVCTSASLGAVA